MMKNILILVSLVVFHSTRRLAAQDISPEFLPSPTTSGPITISPATTTTERSEFITTTLKDVTEIFSSTETSDSTSTENFSTTEANVDVTTISYTTDGTQKPTPDLETTTRQVEDTTITEAIVTTTDVPELSTEATTKLEVDTTTEKVKTTKEEEQTTVPTTISYPPEQPTTSPSRPITTTQQPSTKRPMTTSRPVPGRNNKNNSLAICRIVSENGKPYYNWIFRVIVIPKLCYVCCHVSFTGFQQCTQINPFFCCRN